MGKVKVKVVGDESLEQEQLDEQKKKREQKVAEKKAKVKGVGLGGGQRINSIGVSEEELAAEVDEPKEEAQKEVKTEEASEEKSDKKEKFKKVNAKSKSKKYQENKSQVAVNTSYPLKNSIEILRKFKPAKFDETVELHVNVKEKSVSGSVALPHGTGKELKIVIADDKVLAEVEAGKINFDILVAHPSMMPKLAKVAKTLGPRGLMPNPKAGTVTDKPEEAVKKLSAGQVNFKIEPVGPVVHMRIGKISFKDEQLEDNIKAALSAIGSSRISSVTLKSTMSPGIRLEI